MTRATLPNPDDIFGPTSLEEALRPEHGFKARALAAAYDKFCVHHSRPRFDAEVLSIRTCKLVAINDLERRDV